jgi:Tfp pilus assembly protein PilV
MRPAHAFRETSGHTVVELMVAVVILTVGVLGLSATAGVVARMMTTSLLEAQARFAARAQLETLLATPTDRLTSGEWRRGALSVRWQVGGGDPRRIVLVVDHAIGPYATSDSLATAARSP